MPYSNTTPPSYSLSFLASQAGVFQQDLATNAWSPPVMGSRHQGATGWARHT